MKDKVAAPRPPVIKAEIVGKTGRILRTLRTVSKPNGYVKAKFAEPRPSVIIKETSSKVEIRDLRTGRILRVLRTPSKPSRLGNARIRRAVKEVVQSLER